MDKFSGYSSMPEIYEPFEFLYKLEHVDQKDQVACLVIWTVCCEKSRKPIKSVQNEDKIKDLIDRYEKASDSDLGVNHSKKKKLKSKF